MSQTTETRWSRAMWDAAAKATDYMLARMCPLCPAPGGTRVTVQGEGAFNIPFGPNAETFTITIPEASSESTVTWQPCGHAVIVEGRLDQRT